jgi:telomerase Cajal body protein 1
VSSTVLHSSGTVIATASGQRYETVIGEDDYSSDEEDNDTVDSSDDLSPRPPKAMGRTPDNSIKVWSL